MYLSLWICFVFWTSITVSKANAMRIKNALRIKKPNAARPGSEGEIPRPIQKSLPVDCAEVIGERRPRYTFGPEFMQLGDTRVQAWGGKSNAQKGEDRELHICSGDRCVFAIMDGHSPQGSGGGGALIAQKAKEEICKGLPRMTDKPSIQKELAAVSEEVNKMRASTHSGSTLAGIVIQENSIVVFNAGDSAVIWTGDDLGNGILGETDDHDCDNMEEVKRIRTFRGKSEPWSPCGDDKHMIDGGTMTTRGLGNKSSHRYGFLNEPAVQTLSMPRAQALDPKQAQLVPHWFILSSDGILAEQSEKFSMQKSLSRTEIVRMVALGVREETDNRSDTGVLARIDEMMDIGNSFTYETLKHLKDAKFPFEAADFPPGSGEQRWIVKRSLLEHFPTLPASVADESYWRPKRRDGIPVTHGNGDDCSILLVRVN